MIHKINNTMDNRNKNINGPQDMDNRNKNINDPQDKQHNGK